MAGIQNLWLFIASGLLLNITPGPDSLFVMARSATQGWRAGVLATAGIATGVWVHVLAAALGLSALLATSATAFTVLKVVGAAYLASIGVGMLRACVPSAAMAAEPLRPSSLAAIYRQGFLTNVLNPKVALFFLAFVPQFITHDAPSKPLAFIALGAIFAFNGVLWCLALALLTAFVSPRLKLGAAAGRWLNRTLGAMFVALGARLALAWR